MKKTYFLLIALCFFATTKAQIVNIPDAKFKAKLLAASSNSFTAINLSGHYFKIDVNNDGEIQESEALNVSYLDVNSSNILSLEGIKSFSNLSTLYCYNNQLSTLDISNLEKLKQTDCRNNLLTSINLPIFNKGFVYLNLSNNLFETLELSPNITLFYCNNMPNLKYLFTKNVIFSYVGGDYFSLINCPNIKYICCNENNLQAMQSYLDSVGYNCPVNSYCTFVPGGIFYTIQGNQKFDSNENGCDALDVVVSNFKFKITSGTTTGSLIADASGNYSIPVLAGTHTITPIIENPTYFNIFPTTVNVAFPAQASPFTQNFCVTPNGVHPDLAITLLPLQPARPGFDSNYKIVYKNKGNTTQSGTVNLNFKDSVLDLVVTNPATTTQTTNNLSWDFINLKPFETREITFTLNINSPMETPTVNGGDILAFIATITSAATDETPIDNTFTFNQTVVNSFDPNDKTCLEGTTISPSLIGQYVHYMIRFENSGTANARNIVVKDMIDLSKFDISTLVPTSASHSFVTNITAGNKVEFIFENINLPFDDANNDGYIAFKIKTLPTLKVGDTFTNDASIYFDYNFPIVTNKATSTFKTLGTQDFEFSNYFTLYPNPAKAVLNISSKETIEVQSISIYNTLGQLVLVVTNAEKISKIDVSNLTAGNYFIKINSDKGTSNNRFIKE